MSSHKKSPASSTTAAPTGAVMRKTCACGRPLGPTGECAACRRASLANPRFPALAGAGSPLPDGTRQTMESLFAHDFSAVRIHTTGRSSHTANKVGADAFTIGSSIAFAPNKYRPETTPGKHLLAHELAHVVQQSQSSSGIWSRTRGAYSNSAHEAEANAAAHSIVIQKQQVPALSPVPVGVQMFNTRDPLKECITSDLSIFEVSDSGGNLFFFDDESDLLPDHEAALRERAQQIESDAIVEIHGFSSDQEMLDFSCQRAAAAYNILLEEGVSDTQIQTFYAHSALPGPPDENRSVIIMEVGNTMPAPLVVEQETVAESPVSSDQESADQLESQSETVRQVNKLAIVKDKDDGLNLRKEASIDGTLVKNLPFNTKVFIHQTVRHTRHSKPETWAFITVASGIFKGISGYVYEPLLLHNLPDAEAELYYIDIDGEGLGDLVQKHYKAKGFEISTGNDARVLAMAVYWATINNNPNAGDPGIKLNEQKLREAHEGIDWLDVLDVSDFRDRLRPFFQSVELIKGKRIWLPGLAYIERLKEQDIIPTRPEWQNTLIEVTKGIAGFNVGVVEGFIKSIADVFIGLIELVEQVIDLVGDIISGDFLASVKDVVDAIIEVSQQCIDGDCTQLKEMASAFFEAVAGFIVDSVSSFLDQWNAASPYDRWHFRGVVIGYIAAEIVMMLLSGGTANAVKWIAKIASKMGKVGAKLAKLLEKILPALTRKTAKMRQGKPDTDLPESKGKSKKERELPLAIGAAKLIESRVDANETAGITTAIAALMPLKAKFNWISRFEPDRIAPGVHMIYMIGSRYPIGEFTDGAQWVLENDAEDIKGGQGELADSLEEKSRKQAGVDLGENHHIATRFRGENRELLQEVGLHIDNDLNMIKNFGEHGQLRGWYELKEGRFKYHMKGHHPEYNEWVTRHLRDVNPAGTPRAQALRNTVKALQRLKRIIERYPDVLAYGPDILPTHMRTLPH